MPQFDMTVNGVALNDEGLTDKDAINGFGLHTFGFIWGCNSIWGLVCPNVSTTWNAASGVSTIWTEWKEIGVEDCE